jgi:CTP:molybdopterin cytidylyltransferase MocA
LRRAGADRILVVLGASANQILAALKNEEVSTLESVEFIEHLSWRMGLASSLQAGISAVNKDLQDGDRVLVTLCDLPLIEAIHYKTIFEFVESAAYSAAATSYPSGPGVPACFSSAAIRFLLAHGDSGAKAWLRSQPAGSVATVECCEAATDIDTFADMQTLMA